MYSGVERYITMGANQSTYPLSIGTSSSPGSRKFRVAWDGGAHMEDAYVSGTIYASVGKIGNWWI